MFLFLLLINSLLSLIILAGFFIFNRSKQIKRYARIFFCSWIGGIVVVVALYFSAKAEDHFGIFFDENVLIFWLMFCLGGALLGYYKTETL